MAEKILNTRIKNKYDSLSDWKESSLVLKEGEIAFAAVEVEQADGGTYVPTVLMKVGNGKDTFSALPWTSARASDVYAWAKLEDPTIEQLPGNLKTAITNLQTAVGDGGSVANAIKAAVEALDVDAVTTGKGEIIGSISQVDGKVVVTPRELKAEDIPVIAIAQVDGLENAIADAKQAGTDAATALGEYKTEMAGTLSTELAKKQDVIPENTYDAYGAAAQALEDAKKYADDNDADTQYGIEYDKQTKRINLVSDTSKTYIDATDFIKDGMIESVALSEDGLNLVITWNTDSDKGDNNVTTIPLSGLVDVYTGVDGTTVNVSVSSDNKVSAEVKTGSITDGHIAADAAIAKSKLASDVQTSLGLADSAIQEADLGTMAKEAAADYVKKSEATGYDDILTKTLAQETYQPKGDYASKAQGEAADSAVQTVTAPVTADGKPNGLVVNRAGGSNDVTIGIDETITWVFDCGDSSDVTA